MLKNQKYSSVLLPDYQWNIWACPKLVQNGDTFAKIDLKSAKTGKDLLEFVNAKLFPYLKSFKGETADVKSMKYKIGGIFEFLDNRIASGHTLREVLNIIDNLNFQSQEELFELSQVYENLLVGMGSDGGNSGEFYTPRAVIRAMVETVAPKPKQTIYDGAAGSCGFLIESFEFLKKNYRSKMSTDDWNFLNQNALFGKEKTPLAFTLGVMNMILHGIESPNLYKQNTLTADIRQIQEKDRYDIILANPPFGGKEQPQIQQNFPIKATATELLFLQHFMKSLKLGGSAAIIVPEGVLFQTNNAFQEVKRQLLDDFNVHTIVSMPAGIFLPYSGVKTNIVYFDRKGGTSKIWYYEVATPNKLTKNNPIQFEHFSEFIDLFHHAEKRGKGANDWFVNVADINDYDISAKNPNNQKETVHLHPTDILKQIKNNDKIIGSLMNEVEQLIAKK